MQGVKWRGYCPFPALGRDTVGGVATGATWRAHGRHACTHGRAAARAAARATVLTCTHDTGAKRARPGPSRNGVATHFFVLRPGLAGLVSRHTFWCCDTIGLRGVATHCWCRDTEVAGRAILVS